MKKFISSTILSASLLAVNASQAFANNDSLNPCENNASGVLAAACATQGRSLGSIIGFVIAVIFVVAILIALFFLVWGGIKWITSGGDKGGVEAARSQIIAAVIGLIIVFLAFFILNLVLGLFGLNLFDLRLPTLSGTGTPSN